MEVYWSILVLFMKGKATLQSWCNGLQIDWALLSDSPTKALCLTLFPKATLKSCAKTLVPFMVLVEGHLCNMGLTKP